MLIMIAGPYRSGTGDDPVKIAHNLEVLEKSALAVWHLGHIPVIGEWVALPLAKAWGSKVLGDEIWNRIGYPVADRLLEHCDGVLRLAGESKGADGDVAQAHRLGILVFTDLGQIPKGTPSKGRSL